MGASIGQLVVTVEARQERGKNASRRLRARGLVPANVYGLNMDAFAVAVSPRHIEDILRRGSGRNTMFTLSLGEGQQSRAVMLRELQRDPLDGKLLHVDFLRVDQDKPIHARVPVRLVGTPIGVKNEGGIVDFVHREIEVSCLPSAIPEHFEVDLTELHIDQHVSVKDLPVPEGVEILDEPETVLAVVAEPRVEVTAEAAPAEAEVAPAAEGEAPATTEGAPEEGGSK